MINTQNKSLIEAIYIECRTKAPRTKAPGHIFCYSSFNTLLLGKKISVSESDTLFYITIALFLCS